jgi:hypothetical protein
VRVDDVDPTVRPGEVVVGDQAGERQDVGELRTVAVAAEVRLERDACAAHGVAPLEPDGDERQLAGMLGDLARREPDRA